MFDTKVNISIFDNDKFKVEGKYYYKDSSPPFECLSIDFQEKSGGKEMDYRITFFHSQNIKRLRDQLDKTLKDIERQKEKANLKNREV